MNKKTVLLKTCLLILLLPALLLSLMACAGKTDGPLVETTAPFEGSADTNMEGPDLGSSNVGAGSPGTDDSATGYLLPLTKLELHSVVVTSGKFTPHESQNSDYLLRFNHLPDHERGNLWIRLGNHGYASVSIEVNQNDARGPESRSGSTFIYYYLTPAGTVESFSSDGARNEVQYTLYKRED